jgi:hypothetical protein
VTKTRSKTWPKLATIAFALSVTLTSTACSESKATKRIRAAEERVAEIATQRDAARKDAADAKSDADEARKKLKDGTPVWQIATWTAAFIAFGGLIGLGIGTGIGSDKEGTTRHVGD